MVSFELSNQKGGCAMQRPRADLERRATERAAKAGTLSVRSTAHISKQKPDAE